MLSPDHFEKGQSNSEEGHKDSFLPATFRITIRKVQNRLELDQSDMQNSEAAIRELADKIADGEAAERFEEDAVRVIRRLLFDGILKRSSDQPIGEFTLATLKDLQEAADEIKRGTINPDDPRLSVLEAWANISAESLVRKIRKDITDYQANVIKGPWDGS